MEEKPKEDAKKEEDAVQVIHVNIENETMEDAQDYVKMVGIGELQGCTLIGPPGLGKTYCVEKTLKDLGVKYTTIGGHLSLTGVYELMYEHQDELIFFDDVSQMITETEIMEMLKCAMNTTGDRTLHYRSIGKLSKNIPKQFRFSGRCIFAFNVMDKNNMNVKAIMSRAPEIEIKMPRKDILDAMYKIAEAEGGGLSVAEKRVVTKEIEKYTDMTNDISFRDQLHAFRIYRAFKKMHGPNMLWVPKVQRLFGKKKEHWIRALVRDMVGIDGTIQRKELNKQIMKVRKTSFRTADREVADAIHADLVYADKKRDANISIKPFVLTPKEGDLDEK